MNPALRDLILQSTAFSPTDIPGLALWLDAADASTVSLDVSNNVEEWRDKSGNGRHFQREFATQRPAYSLASINGLNSIYYDGVNDVLTRASEAWAYSYPLNIFVIFRAVAFTPAYSSLWDFYSDPGGGTGSHTGLIKSNGKSAIYTTATNGTQPNYDGTGALTYSTGVTNLFSAAIGATNSITSRGNLAADGSGTGTWTLRTNVGASVVEIGASSKFTRYNEWRIGEFLVYSGSMSTGVRDSIELYLKNKWNSA